MFRIYEYPMNKLTRDSISRFHSDVNGLFDHILDRRATTPVLFGPAVDIAEYSDSFEIVVELPGAKKEDLKITAHQGVLTLMGERKEMTDRSSVKVIKKELGNGSALNRTFKLPQIVDATKVSAELNEGVLRITLPKQEESKPTEIKVK